MPAIRYTPQFTERQYIPMNDIGLISNILQQKESQYGIARALENEAVEQMYGMDVSAMDIGERDRVLSSLQSQIDEAIKKRGGDPGAAVQDIARSISTVGKDPFFTLNKTKLKEIERLERALDRNPNLFVGKDPRKIAIKQGMSAEDLQHDVIDPEQYLNNLKNMYGKLGDKKTLLDPERRGGYEFIREQIGLSPEEVAQMNQDEKFSESLAGLEGIEEYKEDPRFKDHFRNMYSNYLNTLVGGVNSSVGMRPSDYFQMDMARRRQALDEAEFRAKKAEQSGYSGSLINSGTDLQPKSLDELSILNPDKLNSEVVKEAKAAGIPGVTSIADLKRIAQPTISQMNAQETAGRLGSSPPIKFTRENPYQKKAYDLLQTLEKRITTDPSYALQRFSLNSISSSSPKDIRDTETIINAFNNKVSSLEGAKDLLPATGDDQRAYNSIKDKRKLKVMDIIPTMESTRNSMILNIAGEDKDGKAVYFKMKLPRPSNYSLGAYDPLADSYYEFLNGLSPEFNIQYQLINHPEKLLQMGFGKDEIIQVRKEMNLPNPFNN